MEHYSILRGKENPSIQLSSPFNLWTNLSEQCEYLLNMKIAKLMNLFWLFQLFTLTATAKTIDGIEIRKLVDRIYVAEDSFYYPENSAFYIGENSVTVISATWTPETAKLLVEKIRRLTNKPIGAVINTHHHFDRVGGNPYFKKIGAKIIASKNTVDLMKNKWISMNQSL